jgi:hypothetical protein
MNSEKTTGTKITYAGTVVFDGSGYTPGSGTGNWKVAPIPWPGLVPPPPVGQVLITFDKPISGLYSVLVSAQRTLDAPMLAANWGDADDKGFVVVVFNPVATLTYQTVRNGSFSFMVFQ